MSDNGNSTPKGLMARSREILNLAAKLSGREIAKRVSMSKSLSAVEKLRLQVEHQVGQAKLVAQSLGRLKGAAMKLGQLVSIEGADFFPPEVLEVLAQLQDNAPAMDPAAAKAALRAGLGERADRLVNFCASPVASASIGQVHRAELDGRTVAVKVQFPGVEESIDADLALLRKMLGGLLAVSGREIPLDPLLEELGSLLHQEVNYENEAQLMRDYAGRLARALGVEAREENLLCEVGDYVLAVPVEALSGKTVLTMGYLDGVRFADWLRTKPSLADRERVGRLVLDLYEAEFFRAGCVQTDPNFANFFVLPGPKGPRLGLLDFGATKTYDENFRAEYLKLLLCIREGSREELLREAERMHLVDARESRETMDAFVEMLRVSVEPFAPEAQPFDFADGDYAKLVRETTTRFTTLVRYSPPPRALIFLHRKLGGVFQMLKRCEVRMDLTDFWKRVEARA